jgi:hypothetical protein
MAPRRSSGISTGSSMRVVVAALLTVAGAPVSACAYSRAASDVSSAPDEPELTGFAGEDELRARARAAAGQDRVALDRPLSGRSSADERPTCLLSVEEDRCRAPEHEG